MGKIDYEQNNNLRMMESTMLILITFNKVWSNNKAITAVVNEFKIHFTALLAADKSQKIKSIMQTNSANENFIKDILDVSKGEITSYSASMKNTVTCSTVCVVAKTLCTDTTRDTDLYMRAVKALLNEQLDPLVAKFKTSNANFYNQYTTARFVSGLEHNKAEHLKVFFYDEYKEKKI